MVSVRIGIGITRFKDGIVQQVRPGQNLDALPVASRVVFGTAQKPVGVTVTISQDQSGKNTARLCLHKGKIPTRSVDSILALAPHADRYVRVTTRLSPDLNFQEGEFGAVYGIVGVCKSVFASAVHRDGNSISDSQDTGNLTVQDPYLCRKPIGGAGSPYLLAANKLSHDHKLRIDFGIQRGGNIRNPDTLILPIAFASVDELWSVIRAHLQAALAGCP